MVFAALGQSFLYAEHRNRSLCDLRQLHRQRETSDRRGYQCPCSGHLRGIYGRSDIFPACFAYNIEAGQGPSLIFVTLPNVFNNMSGGRFWGSLFFVFMAFAAGSTVIAVFQNIVSFATDLTGCSVKKAVAVNLVVVIILSLPVLWALMC